MPLYATALDCYYIFESKEFKIGFVVYNLVHAMAATILRMEYSTLGHCRQQHQHPCLFILGSIASVAAARATDNRYVP